MPHRVMTTIARHRRSRAGRAGRLQLERTERTGHGLQLHWLRLQLSFGFPKPLLGFDDVEMSHRAL